VCDVATGVVLGLLAYQLSIWTLKKIILPTIRTILGAIKQLFSFTFRMR